MCDYLNVSYTCLDCGEIIFPNIYYCDNDDFLECGNCGSNNLLECESHTEAIKILASDLPQNKDINKKLFIKITELIQKIEDKYDCTS